MLASPDHRLFVAQEVHRAVSAEVGEDVESFEPLREVAALAVWLVWCPLLDMVQ